jgi:hypothetical protein
MELDFVNSKRPFYKRAAADAASAGAPPKTQKKIFAALDIVILAPYIGGAVMGTYALAA